MTSTARGCCGPTSASGPADSRYLVGDFGKAGTLTPFGAHLLAASDGRQTAGIVLYVGQPDESFPFFSNHAHDADRGRPAR